MGHKKVKILSLPKAQLGKEILYVDSENDPNYIAAQDSSIIADATKDMIKHLQNTPNANAWLNYSNNWYNKHGANSAFAKAFQRLTNLNKRTPNGQMLSTLLPGGGGFPQRAVQYQPPTRQVIVSPPAPKMIEPQPLPIPGIPIAPQLQNIPNIQYTGPRKQRVIVNTPQGDMVRVQDLDTKQFLNWEDTQGMPLDFSAIPTGNPSQDFPEWRRIATPAFATGGSMTDPPEWIGLGNPKNPYVLPPLEVRATPNRAPYKNVSPYNPPAPVPKFLESDFQEYSSYLEAKNKLRLRQEVEGAQARIASGENIFDFVDDRSKAGNALRDMYTKYPNDERLRAKEETPANAVGKWMLQQAAEKYAFKGLNKVGNFIPASWARFITPQQYQKYLQSAQGASNIESFFDLQDVYNSVEEGKNKYAYYTEELEKKVDDYEKAHGTYQPSFVQSIVSNVLSPKGPKVIKTPAFATGGSPTDPPNPADPEKPYNYGSTIGIPSKPYQVINGQYVFTLPDNTTWSTSDRGQADSINAYFARGWGFTGERTADGGPAWARIPKTPPQPEPAVPVQTAPVSKDNYTLHYSGNPGVAYLHSKIDNGDGTFTQKNLGATEVSKWLNDEQQKQFHSPGGGSARVIYNPDIKLYDNVQDVNAEVEKFRQQQKELQKTNIQPAGFAYGGDISVPDLRRAQAGLIVENNGVDWEGVKNPELAAKARAMGHNSIAEYRNSNWGYGKNIQQAPGRGAAIGVGLDTQLPKPISVKSPKPIMNMPLALPAGSRSNVPSLDEIFAVKKPEQSGLGKFLGNPNAKAAPLNYEEQINEWLGKPMDKAYTAAELASENGSDPVDNFRHPVAGMYTQQAIKDKVGIPIVGDALGFLGANAMGIGHELGTIFRDERPWDVKLRESAEDELNNFAGSFIGLLPGTQEDKENILYNLSAGNWLPDGIVGDGNQNIYFKDENGNVPRTHPYDMWNRLTNKKQGGVAGKRRLPKHQVKGPVTNNIGMPYAPDIPLYYPTVHITDNPELTQMIGDVQFNPTTAEAFRQLEGSPDKKLRVVNYPYGYKGMAPGHMEAAAWDTTTNQPINNIGNSQTRVNRWPNYVNARVSGDYEDPSTVRTADLNFTPERTARFLKNANIPQDYNFVDNNCADGVCRSLGIDPRLFRDTSFTITDPALVMDHIVNSGKFNPSNVQGRRVGMAEGIGDIYTNEVQPYIQPYIDKGWNYGKQIINDGWNQGKKIVEDTWDFIMPFKEGGAVKKVKIHSLPNNWKTK